MISNHRICSCCSHEFKDWKNQENEGAYCKTCTVKILRKEVMENWKSIDLLCSRLNEKNQIHIRSMSMDKQRFIINKAFENGILTYTVESERKETKVTGS